MAPRLGRYPGAPGVFAISDLKQLKKYLHTWARPGAGMVRWFRFRNVQLLQQEQDWALVSAEITLTAWPQWANILSVVVFVLIRLVGIIVAVVLYFTLRRMVRVRVEKVLLPGQNGLWYLYNADVTETR